MTTANFTINTQLEVLSNVFVAALYDPSTTPMTLLTSQVVPKSGSPLAYNPPFQIMFNSLVQNKAYFFALIESADGTTTGIVNNSVNFIANGSSISLRGALHIYGGVTAGFNVDDSGYTDASLVGWTYDVSEWNGGIMDPNDAVNGITVNPAGGWNWNSTQKITQGDHYVHQFYPQITAAPNAQPSLINSAIIITGAITLDNTYVNKALCIQGASSNFAIVAPPLSACSDFDVLYFYMQGNTAINVRIAFAGSDQAQMDTLKSKIVLGQNEILKLFKVTISSTSFWFVDFISPSYFEVGRPIFSSTSTGQNKVPWSGQTFSRVIYERLSDFVAANITTVTDFNWSNTVDANGSHTLKGKYSSGDGTTTYRAPLASNAGLLRGINGDGTRTPGDFQDWQALDIKVITGLGQGVPGFGEADPTLNGPRGSYSNILNTTRDLSSGIIDPNTGKYVIRAGTSLRDKSSGAFILVGA